MKKPAALLAVALAAAACATPSREPPPKPFAGTRWQVLVDRAPAGGMPVLRFVDGRLEGFAGCNRIAARYVEDSVGAAAIVIGRIRKGHGRCDAPTMELESRLLEVLQSVSSYTIVGDLMTMEGSAGALRLRAEAGTP